VASPPRGARLRPAGGGLPAPLRSLSRHLGINGRHDIAFSLAGRFAGRPRIALDVASSSERAWPALRSVSLQTPPRIELDREALKVDDQHGFVGTLFSFVPKEVVVGLLETAIDEALSRPDALKVLRWKRKLQPKPATS